MYFYSFKYPYILGLLFLFIGIDIFFKHREFSYYIPNIIDILPSNKTHSVQKYIFKYLILISFLIALASPILTKQLPDDTNHTLDMVLSLDTSGSMSLTGFNELDYNQSRWSVIQDVASDFIKKRSKDRVGIVIFGNKSAVAAPLSYDDSAPLYTIQNIHVGLVGKSTALIDSLVTATSLLKHALSSSKLIILLSDGDDTASKTPLEIALKLLLQYKIKVYTIAIGESNNNLLQLIATQTHAKHYRANNKKDLDLIYKDISSLESKTHKLVTKTVVEYLYQYPLLFSFFIAFIFAYKQKQSEQI